MITLDDLKLMNDTLINYYSKGESKDDKKKLKHSIIKEVLNLEKCFEIISRDEAIKILRDIGIAEDKLQMTYEEIIQSLKA